MSTGQYGISSKKTGIRRTSRRVDHDKNNRDRTYNRSRNRDNNKSRNLDNHVCIECEKTGHVTIVIFLKWEALLGEGCSVTHILFVA